MPPKGLDPLLEAVFMRGVAFGSGYPEFAAIPEEEKAIQLRAFLDDWHGNTWSPADWERARREAGIGVVPLCCKGRSLIYHTQPCSPGCDYLKVEA